MNLSFTFYLGSLIFMVLHLTEFAIFFLIFNMISFFLYLSYNANCLNVLFKV
jgi:hypothetical protein